MNSMTFGLDTRKPRRRLAEVEYSRRTDPVASIWSTGSESCGMAPPFGGPTVTFEGPAAFEQAIEAALELSASIRYLSWVHIPEEPENS